MHCKGHIQKSAVLMQVQTCQSRYLALRRNALGDGEEAVDSVSIESRRSWASYYLGTSLDSLQSLGIQCCAAPVDDMLT